jgi:putative protease
VRKGYQRQRLTDKEAARIGKKVNKLRSLGISSGGNKASALGQIQKQSRNRRGYSAELWLRLDTPSEIFHELPFKPDRYVLNLQKNSMASVGRIKQHLGRGTRSIIWALPPIAHESAVRQLRKTVRTLIKSGFRSFQIAHLSQADMFDGESVYLFGDYSLNLLNSQAMKLVSSKGIAGMQCFIEADRDCLMRAVSGFRQEGSQTAKNSRQENKAMLGITVFGSPPLFTSRLAAEHFSYGRGIVSPKNEEFVLEKKSGYTQTRAKKSFSLLPYRHELEGIGINYFVVDLSGLKLGKKEMEDLGNRVANKGKLYRLPTFNYLGTLE